MLEAVELSLPWVGPRSVKRFGATCGSALSLARRYAAGQEYGQMLARSARRHLAFALASQHDGCCAANADGFAPQAEWIAAELGGPRALEWRALGAREVPPEAASLLQFLFAAALTRSRDWAFAPYAYEWCALSESPIRSGDPGAPPHAALVALLHRDALSRLAQSARLAGQRSRGAWQVGVTYAVTAEAACGTLTHESRPAVTAVARVLSRKAWFAASRSGDLDLAIWCAAADAAFDCRLAEGPRAPGSWRYLTAGGAALTPTEIGRLRAGEGAAARTADMFRMARWRDLVGLAGGDRSLRALLAKACCAPPGGWCACEESDETEAART